MQKQSKDFIPALRFHWLTAFYDSIVAWTCRENVFKSRLLAQAAITENQQILDIGSGTGTLAIQIKKRIKSTSVTGIDADEHIISIAQQKARLLELDIKFLCGMSFDMPFDENRFDRCVSSLLFHHLSLKNKELTFQEAYRVLKPNGEIHVADWGKPTSFIMRGLFYIIQVIDGFETTSDNVNGVLPHLMEDAGFVEVKINETISTPLGTITLYSGKK